MRCFCLAAATLGAVTRATGARARTELDIVCSVRVYTRKPRMCAVEDVCARVEVATM